MVLCELHSSKPNAKTRPRAAARLNCFGEKESRLRLPVQFLHLWTSLM